MAQKKDIAAEKARKQKIMVAVLGVALVGIAVIQVPKLMKKDSAPAAAPAAETAPAADTTATGTAAAETTTVVVAPAPAFTGKPAAFVAGVGLPGTRVAPAAKSQLASFTLFEPGDPFVQQVSDETATSTDTAAPAAQPAPEAPAPAQPTAVPGDGTTAVPDNGVTVSSGDGTASGSESEPAKPPAIAYATVTFQGNPQQLQVKDTFPKNDPIFVLVSLKKNRAEIGVAGGSFTGGKTVKLELGKKVTLMNTATGVRYVLKLVYTGSEPETIEGFSTKADKQAAAASSSSTVSATP